MQNIDELSFSGQSFPVYLAKPSNEIKGALVVIHEVWGLSDHIKSIADCFSKEGYLVLAPDLLSETDIAEHADELMVNLFDPVKRNEAQPKLRALMTPLQEPGFAEKTIGKLKVCFDYLYDISETGQNVAVAGFCFGGTYSYLLAVNEPRLKAAIPYYGHAPQDQSELKKITCPILAFYGEKDEALINELPKLKENMSAAGVDYKAIIYPDCGHAFFNDTNKFAYNQSAATDAWQQTLVFLSKHLV
ncbi:MAG: dienelactone hydrolase family protein [Candidatus Saccharimonadales bacterium]